MTNTRKEWVIGVAVVAIFLLLRIPGIGQIYHQDEYRWASIANPAFNESSGSHPPMARWALSAYGYVFGYDTLRVVPLIFGFACLFLVFLVSLRLSGQKRIALIAAALYAISAYSIIASLQIDIDGAILPFFVTLTFLSYSLQIEVRRRKPWLLVLAVVGGILTKLSFALCLAAIAVDWGMEYLAHGHISWRKIGHKVVVFLPWVILAVIAGYLLLAEQLTPILRYASGFRSLDFTERAYGDLGFKLAKSLMLASPLLLFAGLGALLDGSIRRKYRFWWLYISFNALFYLVLFDFTKLTVERYFMFLIIPLYLLSAEFIGGLLRGVNWTLTLRDLKNITAKQWIGAGSIVYVILLVLTIPHDALPLNPKGAYLDRLLSLKLNFLVPFTGGSGPAGFYISALFIAMAFMLMLAAGFAAKKSIGLRSFAVLIFLVLGVAYNLLFDVEYLYGWLSGSVPQVARAAVEYIDSNPSIKEVITYYDIGAYELHLSGKYSARFYTAPSRDYTVRMQAYRGHYMVVNFPEIGEQNQYWQILSRCPVEKRFIDKMVNAYIFDCTKLPVGTIKNVAH